MTETQDPIVQLERAAYARDHEPTLATLEAILRHLDNRAPEPGDGLFDEDDRAVSAATRVASAVSAMISDRGSTLTPDWYFRLIPFKRQLQALFDVSGFQGTALPLRYVSDGVAAAKSPEQEQSQLLKMLLVTGLSDCSEQMLKLVRRLDPTFTAPLILSLVATKVAVLPTAWTARETLLGMGDVVQRARMNPQHLGLVTAAWAQCSYSLRPDRHAFKTALNQWLAQSVERAGLRAPPVTIPLAKKARPRLVIIAEALRDGHPVYRAYADRIRQLQTRFETVLVGHAPSLDDAARGLVDRTAPFPDDLGEVDKMAEHIRRLEPDLVYYPSIGLAPWAVVLANLRLAPIQLMSPGHPATSATRTIDYILMARDMVGDPAAYTERVVISGEGRSQYASYEGVDVSACRREPDRAAVRVAVPASSVKLSWPLIEALRTISERARRPIEWHFFPNETGLGRQHVRAVLGRLLNYVYVHPRVSYDRYMQWLGGCQLAVATVPFASGGSNVDTLRLGLPKVVLNGREAMERADAAALGRLEGLEGLMTDSTEAFVARTVALIDDPDERERLSAHIRAQDPSARFETETEPGAPFAQAVWHVYQHHQTTSTDDRRPIDPFA